MICFCAPLLDSKLLEDGNYVLFLRIPSGQHKACNVEVLHECLLKFYLSWMNYFCSLDLSFLTCIGLDDF